MYIFFIVIVQVIAFILLSTTYGKPLPHIPDTIRFYLVDVPLILFCLISAGLVFVHKRLQQRCIMVVFAVGFSLYLVDIACYILLRVEQNDTSNEYVKNVELRKTYELFQNRYSRVGIGIRGLELMKAMKYDSLSLLPLSNLSHAVILLCNENGTFATRTTDRYGFPNKDELWEAPYPNVIALVGDSFAAGACVQEEDTFVQQLRKNNRTILNFGVPGNGPLSQLGTIREYVSSVRPSFVLWTYYEGNDLSPDLESEKRFVQLQRYLDSPYSQRLLEHQEQIDYMNREYLAQWERNGGQSSYAHISGFMRLVHLRARIQEFLSLHGKRDFRLFQEILQRAHVDVAAWGGKLIFIYIPSAARYFVQPPYDIFHKDEVIHIVRSLNIPLIDMHERFLREGDPRQMYYSATSHCNESGYRVIAESIESTLREQ